MKKYFKARGLKENYDPQNKHKGIFYFAEDTGQLLLDGVSYSEATDLTPYAKAINLPDSVISNVEYLYKYDNENIRNIIFRCTKNNLIDGSNSTIDLRTPIVSNNASGLIKPIPNNVSGVQFYTAKSNGDSDWTYIYTSPNYNGITLYAMGENFESQALIILKNASTVDHGLMSSSDKYKLDSLKNYRAGNGIDITGDTISCTLDTSLYSIVTELPETGLPNKIYLLPSTKTEEGNIYTEYGYVDNKWEEIGKYKADIDLTPYKRALNLPYSVIKGDEISFLGNASKVLFNYKPANLDTGAIPDYKTINFPEATTSFAGTMSASDKIKLDGIEVGAQVNKIESVSVNGTPLEVTNKGVNIPIHEYTAGDGIKLENGKFSLDTIEHTERSYTTKLIGPKEEPALNIPIVDESGKLNKNILIPNVADLFNRTPTEGTGEIDDLGCIRYEDYKNISDYYYNFTKNIFFYPIQDNQLLMYNIGNGIDDDKLNDFLKNPDNYDNWNIPVAIYLSDGLLASGGIYGEVPVHDPNDDSKVYYPGAVFGFKVNIDKSKNNLLTFTEGEDYTDGFSPVNVNTKKLIVPKQSVIDTIVNSNEFKAKQDALTEVQLNNINNAITSISINNIEQVNTNGAVNLTIPIASITENGVMSKEDKAKLDSQPTIKASNATGVTDNDYVVIKKSELDSILSRLSALEGS